MRLRLFLALQILVVIAARAWATDAYVVESVEASLDVGAPVGAATDIAISPGGHLVLLTNHGQMIRRDGPFSGSADTLLVAAPAASAPERGNTVTALIDLAREKGASRNRVFATRSASIGDFNRDAHTIRTSTKTYCHSDGSLPVFAAGAPAARDTTLTLVRLDLPEASRTAPWPRGQSQLAWPERWPAPVEGTFGWSVDAEKGRFTVRVLDTGPAADDPIGLSAALLAQGCDDQAWTALREAIRQATLAQ